MTVLVTQSRGLSDTDLINKTRKPENIEIDKAMKYTKLQNILPSGVNESEISTGSCISLLSSAIHHEIEDLRLIMRENY